MSDDTDNLTFEQALERLESVVRDLESVETGLDKSLARYEAGVRLLRRCREILDAAEQTIRLLTGVDAQGRPITRDFEPPAAEARAADNRSVSSPTECLAQPVPPAKTPSVPLAQPVPHGSEPATAPKRSQSRSPRRPAADTVEKEENLFP
jgi:exodeoxyribonuclease VII small subunit